MKLMSFSMTTEQFRNRSKTVTRRLGWANLKRGDTFMGVVKSQGLKKGEKVQKIHAAECIANTPERLDAITPTDVMREGFQFMTPAEFVEMFCKHNGCTPDTVVNRIFFKHL